TQKKKINPSHSIFKHDLWEIIGPEIEALADSWSKVKETTMGDSIGREEDDEPVMRAKPGHILSSMVEIQDKKELETAIQALKGRDANFSPDEFLEKFRAVFQKVHQACYDHNIETIQAMVSDALYEQFRCRVDEQKEAGIKFKCLSTDLHTVRMARISSDKSFDEIHVLVRGEVTETAIDIVTGETLNAENQKQKISEFWSFIRRPSAKTLKKPGLLEGSCPNCGNPISIGQATICPVCSSFIRSGHYDWVASKITQACEWEYANPRLVPGWNDLVASDSDFTIHQIEDRCAVVFWMLRLVERKRIMEPLLRFATDKCCETFQFGLKGILSYTYMENVSFASATLKAITAGENRSRLYVLVVWSGIPVTFTPQGRQPQIHRFSKPRRDVLVFVRQNGMKTNQNNTLSSAHCSKCGGPLTSNFAITCNYCNAILNDGSEWILEKIINERSQEFIDIICQKQRLAKKVVDDIKKEKQEKQTFRSGRDLVTMSAQMLLADGKIDDAELLTLKKFADRFEMPENSLQGIIEAVKQGELFIPQPEDRREALALLEAAVSMALADGEIAAEEKNYLDALVKKFGYTRIELNMAIKKEERRHLEEKKAEEIRLRKQSNQAPG
ncbi:MAG: TIM44-like domain-containing protein, partial [Candidatus Riflebacteria bacterium]|nr:TIM44-like domain-containing protein [Candidatus Riflebacteria bacterium]